MRKLSRLGVVTLLRNRRELDCWSRFPSPKDVNARTAGFQDSYSGDGKS